MKFLCNKGFNPRMIVPRTALLVRFHDFDAVLVVNGSHLEPTGKHSNFANIQEEEGNGWEL